MLIISNNSEIETVLNSVKEHMQYMFNPCMEHYFTTPQVILGNVLKTTVMVYNRKYLMNVLTEYNINKNRLEISVSMENRETHQIASTEAKRIMVLSINNTINVFAFEDYIREVMDDMIKHF